MRQGFATGLAALAGVLAMTTAAWSSGPVDLSNLGDHHESIGQTDARPLSRGVTYRASTFPLELRVRPPDALWGGSQLQSRKYRFVQFHHQKAGTQPLHGWGYVTLESSVGRTPSVPATVQKLHTTPLIKATPVRRMRVAGYSGQGFDATIVGRDPGNPGISLTPFTTNRHCGFCEITLHGETLDNKFAGDGQLFRILVFSVRGKTVVLYLESSFYGSTVRLNPPTKTFPTFLPFAEKLLSTLRFPS